MYENSNSNNNNNKAKRNGEEEEEKEELMKVSASAEMEMNVGVNSFFPANSHNAMPEVTSLVIEDKEQQFVLQHCQQNNEEGDANGTHNALLNNIHQDAAAYPDPIYAESNTEEGEVNSHTSKSQRHQTIYYAVAVFLIVTGVGIAIGIRFYLNSRQNRNDKSSLYPDCLPLQFQWHKNYNDKLGNGICDRSSNVNTNLNSPDCGYDEGDCDSWNNKYKDCVIGTHPSELGDMGSESSLASTSTPWDLCNVKYNSKECGYDDGNCIPFNERYPNCTFHSPYLIGDGYCAAWDRDPGSESPQNNSNSSTLGSLMNSEECGWEGGDCIDDVRYPGCKGVNINHIGDGKCEISNNTTECMFDGGDCI